MPVPAPMHDPTHIETRLLVVIEMLDAAVDAARREMAQIRSTTPPGATRPPPPTTRPPEDT